MFKAIGLELEKKASLMNKLDTLDIWIKECYRELKHK